MYLVKQGVYEMEIEIRPSFSMFEYHYLLGGHLKQCWQREYVPTQGSHIFEGTFWTEASETDNMGS